MRRCGGARTLTARATHTSRAIIAVLFLIGGVGPACVTRSKSDDRDRASLAQFELSVPPTIAHPLSTRIGDSVELLGYAVSPTETVRPGQTVKLALYWKLNKELESDWLLFTHLVDKSGRYLQNLDRQGPLREWQKDHPALGPRRWRVGKIYVDEQSFTLSHRFTASQVTILTGLWRGSERMGPIRGPSDGKGRVIVGTLKLVAGTAPAAIPTVPNLSAPRVTSDSPLKLDGRLDEAVWQHAARTSRFVNPGDGSVPPSDSNLQGVARIAWSTEGLLIAIEAFDRDLVGKFDPGAVDPHLWTQDTVEIMIDPDGDGDAKDYYEIQVNPQNLRFDSVFDDYNLPRLGPDGPFGHQDWQSQLTSGVHLDGTLNKTADRDGGYTVELSIPWSSFSRARRSPPSVGDTWRINLYVMQENRGIAWSPILGQGNFHRASRFGRVTFVDTATPKAASSTWAPTARGVQRSR